MCSSYSQTHRGHTRAWSTKRNGFSSPPAQSGNPKWHSKHSIWQPKQPRTAGPWSGPASQSCSFGCLSCSSSHSYIFTIHDCERMCCPAFTQHLLLLTALEALALVYKHFSCCMAQLCIEGYLGYMLKLSNPSWKLLGCDQRPYKSDSLINIKHSVRKKEST